MYGTRDKTAVAPELRGIPAGPTEAAPAAPRRKLGRRAYAVVAPLLFLLLLWVWLFQSEGGFKGGPNGKAFEADFAMYYIAAQLIQDGRNPYDHALLYGRERQELARQGLPVTNNRAIVRVGNPPLYFWALEPATLLSFQTAALAWMALTYALSLAGLLGCLRYFGWTAWRVPSLIFVLMPPALLAAFYGNAVAVVFGAAGLALGLLRRYPVAAGALLAVALVKPQVSLPLVGLVLLFHPRERRRLLIGFLTAAAAGLLITLATTGAHSLELWARALNGYSNDIRLTPQIASLAGLYVRVVGSATREALQLALLCLAAGLTLVWWWKHRAQDGAEFFGLGWLTLIWFLATPYSHVYDEILLAIPMLALLGPNGRRLTRLWFWLALYLLFFSVLFLSAAPGNVQLLPIPLLGVAGCMYMAQRRPEYVEA